MSEPPRASTDPRRAAAQQLEFDPGPCVLEGQVVRLEPLAGGHARDLFEAGRDARIWRYMPRSGFADQVDVAAWIEATLEAAERSSEVVFAIVHKASGQAIGSTRYMAIRRQHRSLEVGWTWIAAAHQRTAVNSECKLLLLRHAFRDLGAERVEFKTDDRNLRSQHAIERLGAHREGVLRHHMQRRDGSFRDSVYFSILASEWPAVEARLKSRLAEPEG